MFIKFLPKPSAYLDPGSGSIVIQMILAAILGAGAFFSIYWKKIKGWLSRKKAPDFEENDPTTLPEELDKNNQQNQ